MIAIFDVDLGDFVKVGGVQCYSPKTKGGKNLFVIKLRPSRNPPPRGQAVRMVWGDETRTHYAIDGGMDYSSRDPLAPTRTAVYCYATNDKPTHRLVMYRRAGELPAGFKLIATDQNKCDAFHLVAVPLVAEMHFATTELEF